MIVGMSENDVIAIFAEHFVDSPYDGWKDVIPEIGCDNTDDAALPVSAGIPDISTLPLGRYQPAFGYKLSNGLSDRMPADLELLGQHVFRRDFFSRAQLPAGDQADEVFFQYPVFGFFILQACHRLIRHIDDAAGFQSVPPSAPMHSLYHEKLKLLDFHSVQPRQPGTGC